MVYDEGLAQRIQEYFDGRSDVKTKKMFGGLCFMVTHYMCCGIIVGLPDVVPKGYRIWLKEVVSVEK